MAVVGSGEGQVDCVRMSYNRLAGQSAERLAALSDGIFAVAMTLMVLQLAVPESAGITSERGLWQALGELGPHISVYLMSFMTLGILWLGQQSQLHHVRRADRDLSWMHMAFLCAVTLVPFSTHLLADFVRYRTALILYWLNILLAGVALYASWGYAVRNALVKNDMPPGAPTAIRRRIVIAQALYAFGALLCIFSTYWSIGFIVLVQLNYAIAPRWKSGLRGGDGVEQKAHYG